MRKCKCIRTIFILTIEVLLIASSKIDYQYGWMINYTGGVCVDSPMPDLICNCYLYVCSSIR